MSAERRAKVDDAIEHGETVPANVLVLRDKVGDLWERQRGGWILTRYDGTATTEEERADTGPYREVHLLMFWAPLTVVGVDPEPHPAEREHRCPNGDPHGPHTHRGFAAPDGTPPLSCPGVKPRPLVLTLPEVPEGAVAVTGNRTGRRYVPSRYMPEGWVQDDPNQSVRIILTWGTVLQREGSDGVTPELAPPREPRTWPKLDSAPDMPLKIEVKGELFELEPGTNGYVSAEHGGSAWSLAELRVLGKVREVLT